MNSSLKIRTSIFASACLLLTLFLTLPLNAQRTIRIEYNREAGVGCPSNPEWESWIGVSIGLTPPSCIDTTHFSGTSAQKEVVARAGESFYVGAHTVSSTVGTSYVDVYLDGVLIGHYENYRNPPPTTLCIGGFEGGIFQFGSDLTISTIGSSVPHGDSTSFSHTVPVTPCTTPMWYPDSDWVKIKIVPPGNQLGHLRLGPSGPLVDSLTIRAVQIPSVRFVADGRQPHGATETVTVQASVPAAGITTQTSFAVECNLQADRQTQYDEDWGGDHYDNAFDTSGNEIQISALGCAMTSLAMALTGFGDTVNPGNLNSWLKDNDGYNENARVVWGAANKRPQNAAFVVREENLGNIVERTNPTPNSLLDDALDNCRLVIVNVTYQRNNKWRFHWVLVTSKVDTTYNILDPGSNGYVTLAQYDNRFWGYTTVRSR